MAELLPRDEKTMGIVKTIASAWISLPDKNEKSNALYVLGALVRLRAPEGIVHKVSTFGRMNDLSMDYKVVAKNLRAMVGKQLEEAQGLNSRIRTDLVT